VRLGQTIRVEAATLVNVKRWRLLKFHFTEVSGSLSERTTIKARANHLSSGMPAEFSHVKPLAR
jgi:hypothetical protein